MNRRELLKLAAVAPVASLIPGAVAAAPSRPDLVRSGCSFSTTALVLDVPNRNNRLYPRALMERECDRLRPVVKNRGLLGMMGYPKTGSVIPFSEASHVVTYLEVSHDRVLGRYVLWAAVQVLNTPQGRVLRGLINQPGCGWITLRPMGVGRGTGWENGVLVIDESYRLVSICVVPLQVAA
jgi:hypothetical protein